MQKTAIDLIDKIVKSADKHECLISVLQLTMVLRSLDLAEYEELRKYTEGIL